MPERTTTYTENGLTYQIRVYEEDGRIFAEITVLEGHMDVNAVYYGDDDFSGSSVNLGGPLNMNGAGSMLDGERVQWDGATEVSRPGLGREGTDKSSYLTEGESLTVELNVASLDDISIIGIRATSTSTPEGSIKGVSELEEEDEDPGDKDPGEDPGKIYQGLIVTQDGIDGDREGFTRIEIEALDGSENLEFFIDLADQLIAENEIDPDTVVKVLFVSPKSDGSGDEIFQILYKTADGWSETEPETSEDLFVEMSDDELAQLIPDDESEDEAVAA
jgi:hypothetical protein